MSATRSKTTPADKAASMAAAYRAMMQEQKESAKKAAKATFYVVRSHKLPSEEPFIVVGFNRVI